MDSYVVAAPGTAGKRQLGDRRPGDRPSRTGNGGSRPAGIAIDLGSARTRIWFPGRESVLELPSSGPDGAHRSVRRGRIVDPGVCAGMLRQLVADVPGMLSRAPVVFLVRPVLADQEHRAAVTEALSVFSPASVVLLDSARAAAVGAAAGRLGSATVTPAGRARDGAAAPSWCERPLLVVDFGADLLEVTLLADGRVADARQAELGLGDLGGPDTADRLARLAADLIQDMFRQDKHGAVLGALRRGPLAVGGGALCAGVRLSERLGVPVRPAPAPATAAISGAAVALRAVLHRSTAISAALIAARLPGPAG